jgi:hypothetical protein
MLASVSIRLLSAVTQADGPTQDWNHLDHHMPRCGNLEYLPFRYPDPLCSFRDVRPTLLLLLLLLRSLRLAPISRGFRRRLSAVQTNLEVLRLHFEVLFPWHRQLTTCHFSVTGLLIVFLEIPFLLRICPTSAAFDSFIRKFQSLWGRAAFYIIASIVQWLSIIPYATSLIAAAVLLLFAGIFYAIAAVKGQDFMGSKALGGQSVAQMIV